MLILALTTDEKLTNRLKSAGQTIRCTTVDEAKTIIAGGEVDAVIVGEPYVNVNPQIFDHDNVIIIKNKNDLTKFLKTKKKPDITEVFFSDIEEPQKPARKLRPVEEEPQKVNLKELGTILLVTTNLELTKYLAEFDLRITTTRYSTLKALPCNPKIIIWDIDEEPFENPKILTYKWGRDLLHLEDITQVLANLDITLIQQGDS